MEAPSMAKSKVSKETISKAVSSLLKWKSLKSESQKPQLLSSDEFIYLVITLNKIPPKSRTNAYKIPLPNPLYGSEPGTPAEFCVIIDDRYLSSKSAKLKVMEENLPVSKVIKFTKLKSDYKAFESKRKLCDSYELFLADKRIVPLLPKAIGRHFYKKKKVPVPIELGRKNWKEQIDRVCGSALYFVSTGTCSVVKVAKGSMREEEIVENLVAAVDGIVEVVPKKWGNVRSIHLKYSDSLALPVYQAVPEMKMKIDGGVVVAKSIENVSGGELGSDKDGESEKSKTNASKKVGKKKGRIHEVRYMDNVGGGEMVGGDESGSEDEEDGEMGSDEIVGKKRKNGDGEKNSKSKLNKKKKEENLKKGEKGLKQKEVSGKSVTPKKVKRSKVAV